MFPIVTVPDAAAWLPEPLGSKRKFWFQNEASITCLFKEARQDTGEDWSEKVYKSDILNKLEKLYKKPGL